MDGSRSGPMGEANDAVDAARRRAHSTALERERIPRLISWTDSMVEELEGLNLRDVRTVDFSWRPRLALLFAFLPFDYRPSIRARPSPTELLDVIFDVQAYLFERKNVAQASHLRDVVARELDRSRGEAC